MFQFKELNWTGVENMAGDKRFFFSFSHCYSSGSVSKIKCPCKILSSTSSTAVKKICQHQLHYFLQPNFRILQLWSVLALEEHTQTIVRVIGEFLTLLSLPTEHHQSVGKLTTNCSSECRSGHGFSPAWCQSAPIRNELQKLVVHHSSH